MGADRSSNLFRHADDAIAVAAGATIFSTGDDGDVMYGVQEGEVELRVADHVVEVVREGGYFGELALIDKAPRTATAVARTACKLVRVDDKHFQRLVQQTPYFSLDVIRTLSRRLRATDKLIAEHES